MIEYVEQHLRTLASVIGSLAVIVTCRKWIYAFWSWCATAYTRPARIEAMIERINYAIFNAGNGMERQLARLSACHSIAFEAAPYPAFECDSNGRNARTNEAYRVLTQTRSEDDMNGTRWHQVAYGPLAPAYHEEFARCSMNKEDFVGVCDFKNPMTDQHRGRWRIHAPAAQIGNDCLYVGRFISALDDKARKIAQEEGWSVRMG